MRLPRNFFVYSASVTSASAVWIMWQNRNLEWQADLPFMQNIIIFLNLKISLKLDMHIKRKKVHNGKKLQMTPIVILNDTSDILSNRQQIVITIKYHVNNSILMNQFQHFRIHVQITWAITRSLLRTSKLGPLGQMSYFIRIPVSIQIFNYNTFLKIWNLQSTFLNVMSWIINQLWTGCKVWVINIFASF